MALRVSRTCSSVMGEVMPLSLSYDCRLIVL
jgi:hypothetical protein